MNAAQLRKLCMSLASATEEIQWDNDRVFKIGGKMFACSGLEDDSRYSFKVEDARFLELTDQQGIVPAPYLARARWVQIDPQTCRLSGEELAALVQQSYQLILGKLSKKKQRELTGDGDV